MKTLLSTLVAALMANPLAAQTDPADGVDPAVARLVAELQAKVAETPDSVAARGDLALAYEANGLWQDAHQAYAAAAELAPEDPDWRLHQAITLRQAGEFDDSLAILRELVEAFPNHPPALQRLGLAHLDAGDDSAARAAFMGLIQTDHRLPEGHAGFGDTLLRSGEVDLAVQQLEYAVAGDPSYRSAHYLLGQAYRAAGRLDDARRHLALGQGAQPRFLPDSLTDRLEHFAVNLTARLDQASASLGARDPERAIALLEAVRSDHPTNTTVLNNLAIAHMHRGDIAKARGLLDEALAVNDEKFSTYLNLAALGHRQNRPDEALRWLDLAVERAPGVVQVHIARAGTLLRLGRLGEAIGSFEQALATDPQNQEPYLALANLELRRGRVDDSASYSRRALAIWPDLLAAHLLLFHASIELPNLDQASAELETIRTLAPDHPRLAEFERMLAETVELDE